MKKNFLKSALAVAALESIDSAEQVNTEQKVADQVVAGTNLPAGGAASDAGGAPAGVASAADQTTVPVTDVAAAAAAVGNAVNAATESEVPAAGATDEVDPAAAGATGEPSASDISTGSATDPATPSPDQVAPSATGDAAGAPAEGTAPGDASAAAAAPAEGAAAGVDGAGATDAGAALDATAPAAAAGTDLGAAGGDAGAATGADAAAGADAGGADAADTDLGADLDADGTDGTEQPDVNAPAGEQPDVGAVDAGAAEGTGGEGEAVADELTEEADSALSEEIVSSIGEVDAAAGKIDDVGSDVETMNEALESLDNCNAILRRSIQRGGLNQDGAALLRNNLNTVTKNLKIRPLALPALEDLEDPSARIDAADVSASQVTGLMQRISETVRGGLKSFADWIATTTAQLTDVYARLEKRADLLGQRAANAEGDKGGEVEAVGMVAGGQSVQNLVKYLQGLEKSVVALGQVQTYDSYIQLLDTAEELVKNPAEAEELAATATKQLLAFRKKIASVSAQGQGENAGGSVHFLGNRSVQFSIPGDLNDLAGFSSKTVSGGDAQAGSVPALKQKEVIAVCAKIKELAGSFRQSLAEANGNVKQINKRITDKMGVIVDLSSRLDPKDGEAGGSVRKAANWVSRIVTTSSKLPVHAVYAEVPRTLTIALDFASKSIGAARPAVAPEVAAAQ